MRKRAVTVRIAVLVCVVGIYGIYYVSPYGRHNREAAAYERKFRSLVVSIGEVQVVSGEHQVSGNRWGEGGECSLLTTLEVSTPLGERLFEGRLKAILAPYADDYLYQQVTKLGDRDNRHLFRVEAGTLADGGSLDLRCG